ncbi:MAG: murein L,D-transpeptidase catalytic domain family protein [Bdellovibrionaceae bacterium]|nr:murein L,D-transpeptidase catalytic domain family protein [Pseudobdellovibrionaceae bacterium]
MKALSLSFVLAGLLTIQAQAQTQTQSTSSQQPLQQSQAPRGSFQQDSGRTDLKEFDHLDPRHIVPERPLRQALTYYKVNRESFTNRDYIVVIDFTQPSSNERLYVINMKTGEVDTHATSHGRGSDPKRVGRAQTFSNRNNSHASSLGFYRTAETYMGKHGYSLRLDGLSPTNSNARDRAVVVHAASYVRDNSRQMAGRSHGCPALDPRVLKTVVSKIKGGALMYAWAGQ